jgi:formylmethanofuran dehydrogenase subunit E
MTAPTTTLSEADLDLIEKIHGHLCPMVLLGARTARRARTLITDTQKEVNLYGYYRGYGCALDGIQIYSGCTWGNQNLVRLRGRNFAFILSVEGDDAGIMVSPLPGLLERIREERTPENRAALIRMFTSAPDEELLKVSKADRLGIISEFPGS